MKRINGRIKRLLPNAEDTNEVRDLKIAILVFIVVFGLMITTGIVVFFISLRGSEETLVPDVVGKDIVDGLLELQEKELYPLIQIRYSSDYDRGVIMHENPNPGSVVKAGRKIEIVVSKGPIIDRVENFVGQNINEVRMHLQTLFASHKVLLKIDDNKIMYKYDNENPPGTILEQKPAPGTPISGVMELEFVVSKGPKGEKVEIGKYIGENFKDAIADLASKNIPFIFTIRNPKDGEEGGMIVSQSPEPQSEIEYGSVVQLEMTRPLKIGSGNIFGVFKQILPDYPILVDIRLDAVEGDHTETLLKMKHPGGPISVPYIVPENTELILYIFGREEIRQRALPEAR